MKNKLVLCAFTALILLSGCTPREPVDGQYASLAQCLTGKGVKFYGAFWCPHCTNQKKMFGDDMRYIDYIECDPRGENAKPDECKKAGVTRYPSWFFPGQGIVTGEIKPEVLAEKANCEIAPATQETSQAGGTQAESATAPPLAAPTQQ